jgi:GTP-binding protein HflX
LDPTLRRLDLPGAEPVVLADTVGFISRLPHELVAAFRSTLRETCEASLLLHIIDASHPDRDDGHRAGRRGAGRRSARRSVPCLRIFNKIDLTRRTRLGWSGTPKGNRGRFGCRRRPARAPTC